MQLKLDIGARIKAAPGFVTLDRKPPCDIIADMEDAGAFLRACRNYAAGRGGLWMQLRANHVLEHIRNLMPLLDSCWLLLEPGGTFFIRVPMYPHGGCWHDPTHVRVFTRETFDYFTRHRHFAYLEHYWDYAQPPSLSGPYSDEIVCTLRKPAEG